MTIAIGVDGGGTHARAVIVDDRGREMARAQAPGAVVTLRGSDAAVAAVAAAVRAAAESGGVALPGAVLWAGLAGAGHEESRVAVERGLAQAGLAARVRVGTDAEAAFHAAFQDGPGLMLIAGTGSVAWGRGAAGEVRVGGWGQQLGDEGSGYAIGLGAVRAIVRADDGRAAPTLLRAAILDDLHLGAPVDLIPWAASASKSQFAALVPLVGRCAAQGDETARGILDEAADDLEAHVRGILAKSGPWRSRPGLLLYGGVIGQGGTLRDALERRLASQPVDVLHDDVDAASGAASLALASLGPRGH